jgi:mannan endo-1,4-beta-mannosidase
MNSLVKISMLSAALFSTFALGSCSSKSNNEATQAEQEAADTTTPREQLLARLERVREKDKCIFGHHDDTAYGHGWKYIEDRSDIRDVVGDYPGLMNWDLGLIEWNSAEELDGVPFDFIRKEVAKQNARGAINSFSWHPRNPATKGDSWDTSVGPVHDMVTKGTALNDTLNVWLERAADFLGSLKDDKGNRIAVLFRPWHEHTGTWFWWGKDKCSPEDYKALWHITREVFDSKGLDNIIWVYSPDKLENVAEYTERYPGDDYVDILGTDAYHFNGEAGLAEYRERVGRQLDAALALSQKNGKMIALSETGSESLPMDNWWTDVLGPICDKYPIVYVCVWRNAHDKPNHFYVPYFGQGSSGSFKKFYIKQNILFAQQLKAQK